MLLKHKKILTFSLLGLGLIIAVFFRQPTEIGDTILRIFIIGNILFILVVALVLHLYFQHHYRHIKLMLRHIAESYDTPLHYSFTPVSLIKKQLNNSANKSYLKYKNYNTDTKSTIIIVHEGQDYEFFHHLDEAQVDNLASVLIYYLQHDIPFEILYEHSKTIHNALTKS